MTWYVFIDTYYLNNNLTFYSFEKNCSMSIWLFSIWINQVGLFSFHLIWLTGLQRWILSKHLVGKLFYWENFNQLNYFTSASGQWFKPRAAFSQYNTTLKQNQPSRPEMVHPKRIMTLVLSFLFTLQIFIMLVQEFVDQYTKISLYRWCSLYLPPECCIHITKEKFDVDHADWVLTHSKNCYNMYK